MRIQEVEKLTEMPRANIRFYESKKLITPNRDSNGYRNYTKENIDTLKKIKLLRKLHISVEDILKIQKDKKSLLLVLSQSQVELNNMKNDIDYAMKIINEIKNDKVSYKDLNPEKYLLGIEKTAIENKTNFFSIESDRTSNAFNPWRRFFARQLDLTLYSVIWSFLLTEIFRINILQRSPLSLYLDFYIVLLLTILFEPILISLFGTTLGKAIFGLKLSDLNGNNLKYKESRKRTINVIIYGFGLGIPIYSLYRLYVSYKKCNEEEIVPWDMDISHEIKDTKTYRIAIFLLVHVIIFSSFSFIPILGHMPVNRGNITTKEFVENYNDLSSYFNFDNGYILKENGEFEDQSGKNGEYYIRLNETPFPDFKFTENNNQITKISFEVEIENSNLWISSYSNHIKLSILSYVFAQADLGIIEKTDKIDSILYNNHFSDFNYQKAGISVRCDYEFSGFNKVNNSMLIPIDDNENYYKLNFEMIKQ